MIQYLEISKDIEGIEEDNKYHQEQLSIVNELLDKLNKDKVYLEERLRMDKIRLEQKSKPKN
jgi:hypothetical protein